LALIKGQTNSGCPVYGCTTSIGGPCTTNQEICSQCTTNLNLCITAAGANGTGVCICQKQAIACYQTSSACYSYTSSAITYCNANYDISFYGFCNCGTVPAAPTMSKCSLGYGLYCNENGLCSQQHTTGACDPKDTSVGFVAECSDPNGFPFSQSSFICANSSIGYQCESSSSVQLATNDGCMVNTNCFSNSCVGGTCQAVAKSCNSNSACSYGTYCDINTLYCLSRATDGSACGGINEIQCQQTSICNFYSTCIPLKSANSGSYCLSTNECQFGFYCAVGLSQNATCMPIPTNVVNCNTVNDCTNAGIGGQCTCNNDGTKTCKTDGVPTSCSNQYNAFSSCLSTHQCQNTGFSGSCGARYCSNQNNCYYNCAQLPSLGTCVESGLLACTNPASTIFVSAWIIAILLLCLSF